MSAAPARAFFSAGGEPLLLSGAYSPAAGAAAGNNGGRLPRGRHSTRPYWAAAAAVSSGLNTLPRGCLLDVDLQLQEGLMTNVQENLRRHHRRRGRETMVAVDNLKRLCIDHYFEEEIQSAMGACGGMDDLLRSDDLFDATLALRLMREAGRPVSADDVLRRFTAMQHGYGYAYRYRKDTDTWIRHFS